MKSKKNIVVLLITILYCVGLGGYAFISSMNTQGNLAGFKFEIPVVLGTIYMLLGSLYIVRTLFFRETSIQNTYLGMAVIIYSLLLWTMPPLHGHDICFHFDSSYVLSNRLLGLEVEGFRNGQNSLSDYMIREDDLCLEYSEFYNYTKVYADMQTEMFIGGNGTETLLVETGTYQGEISVPIYFYLPQAIGFAVARLLGLNVFWLLFLGRLCVCVVCIALTYVAVKNTPFGKEIFLLCGLIPTTLHSCASLSRDALILAVSFYFIAKCLQIVYSNEKKQWWDYVIMFLALILLVPYKLVYIPFVLLLGLLMYKNYLQGTWNKKYLLMCAGILLLVAGVFVIINFNYLKMYITGANGYSMGEDSPFTVPYILANMGQTIGVILKTLVTSLVRYYTNMIAIGDFGGGIHKEMVVVYTLFLIALVLITYKKGYKDEQYKIATVERIIMMLTWLGVSAMVMFAFLLCTPYTNDVIIGVQGRYFTPVLPLIILSFFNIENIKAIENRYWIRMIDFLEKTVVKKGIFLGIYGLSLLVVVNMYVWVVTYVRPL